MCMLCYGLAADLQLYVLCLLNSLSLCMIYTHAHIYMGGVLTLVQQICLSRTHFKFGETEFILVSHYSLDLILPILVTHIA